MMLMLLFPKIGILSWTPDQRSILFVSYGDGVKGYRLWDPTTHKIMINKHVVLEKIYIWNNEKGLFMIAKMVCLQNEEVIVWPEAVSQVMVQEV